ncbi:MAG: putative chaperone protein [Bradymonadia bacterium]|jgi:hypothetical chaperone protein
MRAIGWDFGTTNSAVALRDEDGVRLARFRLGEVEHAVFRSLLYFPHLDSARAVMAASTAGPAAIESYLADDSGRLIQSLKSFVASSSFQRTSIFGRSMSCVDLLTLILKKLRHDAEADLGPLGTRAVVGRPVTWVSGDGDDEAAEERARDRMTQAMANAGFDEIVFEYEPVGAAYGYAEGRPAPELILVADFGGGTSDFSLMQIGDGPPRILSTSGAPVAGDVFDQRIVEAVIAPALGSESRYRRDAHWMQMPSWIYGKLARWHHLSFLRERSTVQLLVEIGNSSDSPEQIKALLYLVRANLGFHLFRKVEAAKVGLSSALQVPLHFSDGPIDIETQIDRADFDAWIAADVARIEAALDECLDIACVDPAQVDRVFMTGGTSLVPKVQQLFVDRFGADRLVAGDRFTSVAAGLAHRAAAEWG